MHVTVTHTPPPALPLKTVPLKRALLPFYWPIVLLMLLGFIALPSASLAAKRDTAGQATGSKT